MSFQQVNDSQNMFISYVLFVLIHKCQKYISHLIWFQVWKKTMFHTLFKNCYNKDVKSWNPMLDWKKEVFIEKNYELKKYFFSPEKYMYFRF